MPRSHTRTVMLVGAFTVLMVCATESSAQFPHEFRTIDGTHNNLTSPVQGSAGVELLRLTTIDYEDGAGSPAGEQRSKARSISNVVFAQHASIPNTIRASDFVWQWGQFLDHDLDLTVPAYPVEPFDIPVPLGDPFFDPNGTGTQVIPLDRSDFVMITGVRQQLNEITAYIDASQVYGSDSVRAAVLRTDDDTGQLRTSAGRLLPFNTEGLPNAPNPDAIYFLAGDVRANEQVGLTALHTLFVREHNRWAAQFRRHHRLSGDDVYQRARALVAAEIQAITYNEFLPVLLGPNALAPYQGYNPDVNAGIANVFSTAAYRFGHSMLSPVLLRLDTYGQPIHAGHLPLQDAFFAPEEIILEGIKPLLRGLASQQAQQVDASIVDAVRNFLFGPPGSGGLDLAAMDIQRGRDHGLPAYNQVRVDFGLAPVADFSDISADPTVQANLQRVYASVDDIDIWVGGLAEDHVNGGLVGETFFTIIKDQFERLRDGDRFWYQTYLPPFWVRVIERRTLATIIRENTSIGHEIQDNVFLVPRHHPLWDPAAQGR
jgi:peroxidase